MSPRSAKAPEQPVDNTVAPTPAKGSGARSRTRGDAPQAILDRYLIERDRQGRPARFYRDHRATEPMFRDEGRKLTTTQSYPDAVADMLKIAQHRGWTEVRVSGDEGFRREAWIQARSLGLEVKGYRPRDRDRQAADEPSVARSPSSRHLDQRAVEERLRAASVVVKRLIEDPAARTRLMEHALQRLHNRMNPARTRDRDSSRDRRS
ncbi:LPD7 domain-containing protein [Brevundimonas variabilis]|uniref:Large polyvalent protein-associated domain-containing protein n=1 Tax=Brevundimonas variabilis TaxID=74312 RepID=A0A7W9CKB1_9CAUL|nr:LPD7 domain-containing protein [Brevundimonas variabilis]MBB5747066.1 hypothetical protein [Brevundimonas variabilis]